MSFIGGRVNVDNFQRVCMELRMQSSLEDGEWNLLKLGLETMVRSQGFSEVDFRFIRLTMMTKRVRSWRRVWRPTWARVTWKVLYGWWAPECAASDWEEDTVKRQEWRSRAAERVADQEQIRRIKMECHPKAPELQKAAKDLCESNESELWLYRQPMLWADPWSRNQGGVWRTCKLNVMELGRLNGQFPRNRAQQLGVDRQLSEPRTSRC